MRYLSWDDVLALETFLVEDNDDAIGLQIHTGIYDRTQEDGHTVGYSRPDTVQTHTLEELAGGELLRLEPWTLCAVVGNRLYYKNDRGWVYNTGTAVVSPGRGNAYKRAVLTFREQLKPLPDETVISLDRFLVRDNKRVKGIRIMPGYKGIGGSNTSGFSSVDEKIQDYTAEQLNGADFLWVEGSSIRALAGDILHFCHKNQEGKHYVFTLDYRERDRIFIGDSVAYDTVSATEVVLLLK